MLVFDAPDRAVSRAMQRYICDGFRNGAIGHQLSRMFYAAGIITPTEAADWIASLEAANDAGHFFCGVAGFLVCGRKP